MLAVALGYGCARFCSPWVNGRCPRHMYGCLLPTFGVAVDVQHAKKKYLCSRSVLCRNNNSLNLHREAVVFVCACVCVTKREREKERKRERETK